MVKTLADGRILLTALTTKPADINAITVAEMEAGQKISCRIMKSDYQLGATGDSTLPETELCVVGEGQALGATSYGGNITVFRYLDSEGIADVEDDFAWDLVKEKGTELVLVEREGPLESAAVAAGQEYSAYVVQTGTPQKPSNRTEGYIKRTVQLAVLQAAENKVFAA